MGSKKITFTIVLILLKTAELQVMRPPVVNNNIYFPFNNLHVRPNQYLLNRPTGALNPGQYINRPRWLSASPYQLFPYNRLNNHFNLALIQEMNKQMINRMIAVTRPSVSYETHIPEEFNKIIDIPNTEDYCLINQSTDTAKGYQKPLDGQSISTTEYQGNPLINTNNGIFHTQHPKPENIQETTSENILESISTTDNRVLNELQTTRYQAVSPSINHQDTVFHIQKGKPDDILEVSSEDNSEDIDIRGGFD